MAKTISKIKYSSTKSRDMTEMTTQEIASHINFAKQDKKEFILDFKAVTGESLETRTQSNGVSNELLSLKVPALNGKSLDTRAAAMIVYLQYQLAFLERHHYLNANVERSNMIRSMKIMKGFNFEAFNKARSCVSYGVSTKKQNGKCIVTTNKSKDSYEVNPAVYEYIKGLQAFEQYDARVVEKLDSLTTQVANPTEAEELKQSSNKCKKLNAIRQEDYKYEKQYMEPAKIGKLISSKQMGE